MRLVEAVLLTACITIGVFLGLTLRAVVTDDTSSCTVERVNATTATTTCD